MTIDTASLEALVRTQGIILEHQTHDALLKYFRNQRAGRSTLEHQVSRRYTRGHGQEQTDFEVDVYFEGRSFEEELPYAQEGPRGAEQAVFSCNVITVVVIECKGHPGDGFLLCRHVPQSGFGKNKKQSLQYLLNPSQPNVDQFVPQDNEAFVDWAHFYALDGNKDRKNREYKEDKSRDKMRRGFEQMENHVAYGYQQMSRLSQARRALGEGELFRLLPLLVTNAEIVVMDIGDGEVKFSTYPWVTHLNYLPEERAFGAHRNNYFTYVVQLPHLNSFLDAYLTGGTLNPSISQFYSMSV